jgi:hypothetical protein
MLVTLRCVVQGSELTGVSDFSTLGQNLGKGIKAGPSSEQSFSPVVIFNNEVHLSLSPHARALALGPREPGPSREEERRLQRRV